MSQHPTGDTRSTSWYPESSPAAPSEYARLLAYAREFTHLLMIYDGTPERWDHLPASYLWFYLRGMVTGMTVSAVRARVAELEQECVQIAIRAEEEADSRSH